MRAFVAALCLALGASAPAVAQSRGTAVPQSQTRNIDVGLRGHELPVRLDTLAVWTIVPALPAQTFAALREVLDTIQLPVDTRDSLRGVLWQAPFNTSRRIMGKRMSWAIDCGERIGGENADSYRIHMAYAFFLEPTVDQQTRLGIALAAGANNVDGAFRSAMACSSKGQFEQDIAMLVKARLQLR